MHESLDIFVDGVLKEFEAPHADSAEKSGDQIGHYTLIEELGAGGFGVVWRAEQTSPVRRVIALKIIKLGMDTQEVIARFGVERQALAVLDHPNIAKVFDAGATPTGRPYFVMELVNGPSLTNYCNGNSRPLHERLTLFTDVCRAIQHAHQKGIIHRDLKPTNILVTQANGKPVPKVIDFGIAKATGEERLADNTLVTRLDRLMGTPAYMSPEQAEPGMDIDTRTDIYSLGVILYELLTGQVPFEIGADRKARRERGTQRPSTRIKSLTADQLKRLGETQRVDGPKLLGLVKGDLDWIAMKALEQDRTRRYDSANALAEDILCFLRREPVSARPPTAAYLLKRFTQRNKLAVGAAAVIVLVLVGGIATSTWMYLNEKRALTKSQQVSGFLKKVLAQAGVHKSLGRDATMMREILDETAKSIGTDLAGQPEVQAELRSLIGQTYEDLNEYDLAVAQTSDALRLQREFHQGDHQELAAALLDQASVLEALGRMKEAEPLARDSLAMRQRLFGDDDLRTCQAHALLAWILGLSGRAPEGEKPARIAMALWRRLPNKDDLSNAPRALGMVLHTMGREEESLAVKQEELEALRKIHGLEHPYVHNCLDNLGFQLWAMRRYDEAEPVLQEALRQGRKFYQDRDALADHALKILARIASARKEWEAQLKYAREALAAAKRVYPEEHRYLRDIRGELAKILMDHAERAANEGLKSKDRTAAEKALGFINELRTSKDFQPAAQASSAWLTCLQGHALTIDSATQAQARPLLQEGLAELKKKSKPTAEDQRRIKQAEMWLPPN